jgi:peptidyl-prolyl cis-trans isomerase-like protein 2
MEVLAAMEAVETDDEDRPRQEIKICRTSVFTDPFRDAEEELLAEEEAERRAGAEESTASGGAEARPKAYHSGVGRYIPKSSGGGKRKQEREAGQPGTSKKRKLKSTLGDFSAW